MNSQHILEIKQALGQILVESDDDLSYEQFCDFFLDGISKFEFGLDISLLRNALSAKTSAFIKFEIQEKKCRRKELIIFIRIQSYWKIYRDLQNLNVSMSADY